MSGLPPRRIRATHKFKQDVDDLRKGHYKKNKRDGDAFADRVASILQALTIDPRPPHSRPEPWPTGMADPAWEFRKIEFKMPGLKGASGQGRLMYLANDKEIIPVWVYTHEEYSQRPAPDDLRELLKSLLSEATSS